MNDKLRADRAVAAFSAFKIDPKGKHAIPALIISLTGETRLARNEAAKQLSKIGAPAVPALTKALKDEDEKVRKAAQEALKRIQAKK